MKTLTSLLLSVSLYFGGCLDSVSKPATLSDVGRSVVSGRDAGYDAIVKGDVSVKDSSNNTPEVNLSNICREGMRIYSACGLNGNGLQFRYCLDDNTWSNLSGCVDNDSCVAGSQIKFYNAAIFTLDVGECRAGFLSCDRQGESFKYIISTPEVLPRQDLCNGLNDDCDTDTDEDYNVGMPCSLEVAGCVFGGNYVCLEDGRSTMCVQTNPEPLRCVDSGVPERDAGFPERDAGVPVDTGMPDVGYDAQNSDSGIHGIDVGIVPSPEVCNGVDDDLDGLVDNLVPESRSCGVNLRGVEERYCVDGAWSVWSACDNFDQCLLGNIRESYNGPDGTLGVGVCKAQVEQCVDVDGLAQYVIVSPQVLPSVEVCNAKDDDCNRIVDDGFDVGQACEDLCRGAGTVQCLGDGNGTYCFTINIPGQLYNADFERAITPDGSVPCWDVRQGSPGVVSLAEGYNSCQGQNALREREGNNEAYIVSQVVNLQDRVADINANHLQITATDIVSSASDVVGFGIAFYDANMNFISENYHEGMEGFENVCNQRTIQQVIPPNTNYLEVRLTGTNNGGNTNNATHDNITLDYAIIQ
ncbi:MAG: hypothetical protein Q7R76_00575 [Candidatus Woesearchaeota archaeon]|nr:hypothetical protein [Candidatus Woesearchaeota archaeon]